MEFAPDDHPSETKLKLQVVEIYNRKLEERNKRKRFLIDRKLVDVKALQTVRLNYIQSFSQSDFKFFILTNFPFSSSLTLIHYF
jgi:hypothetical protein